MRMVVLFVKDQGFSEAIGVFESEELAQESIVKTREQFHEPDTYESYLEKGFNDPREYEYYTQVFSLNENGLL